MDRIENPVKRLLVGNALIILIVGFFLGVVLYVSSQDSQNKPSSDALSLKSVVTDLSASAKHDADTSSKQKTARFFIDVSSDNIALGDSVNINVWYDSGRESADEVKLVLTYDPTTLVLDKTAPFYVGDFFNTNLEKTVLPGRIILHRVNKAIDGTREPVYLRDILLSMRMIAQTSGEASIRVGQESSIMLGGFSVLSNNSSSIQTVVIR